MSQRTRLGACWRVLLAGFGVPDAVAADCAPLDRYAEPHRRYHDLRHLAQVLGGVDELAPAADDLVAVRLAAWFHDAVYEPTRRDNEARSAALAERVLARVGVPAATVAEVARLVRLTATHTVAPGDRNGAVLCDADLAILGTAPARYDEYAAAVRAEYALVDDNAFRTGRAAVLAGLLGRPRLYATAAAGARFELAARRNVSRELAGLTGGGAVPPR